MLSRRGFIQIGAASVGSLALKPFGLLPALAQNGPDYRALVCVFLFGGNDSNNSIIPMDDASFKAYSSLRGNLALPQSNLTPIVDSLSGSPYAFHIKLTEMQSMFASKELAVVANCGSLVQPVTRAQYQARSRAARSTASSRPSSSADRTTPTRAAAGFRRPPSTNTAQLFALGSAFPIPR
jgi:uncharacterized protein (DUF1501 family)